MMISCLHDFDDGDDDDDGSGSSFSWQFDQTFFLSSLEAFHIELVSKFSFFAVQPRGRR